MLQSGEDRARTLRGLTYTSIITRGEHLAKPKRPSLEDYQYSAALPSGATSVSASNRSGSGAFDLSRFDPGAKPFSSGDKARDKHAVAALATELDALQDLLLRRPALQAAGGAAGHRHERQGRHDPRRVRRR